MLCKMRSSSPSHSPPQGIVLVWGEKKRGLYLVSYIIYRFPSYKTGMALTDFWHKVQESYLDKAC